MRVLAKSLAFGIVWLISTKAWHLVAVPLKFVNTCALRGGRGRGGPGLYTHIFLEHDILEI